MALNKVKLKQDLLSLFNDMREEEDYEKAIDNYADRFSTIIDSYIKSATVAFPIAVQVNTGTGTGATTETGKIF